MFYRFPSRRLELSHGVEILMKSSRPPILPHYSLLIATAFLAAFSQISVACADQPCMDRENERLIRECLNQAYDASEKRLADAVAHAVSDSDTDAERKRYFDASQAAWQHYRDLECDFEGDAYRGGTLQTDQADLCTISKNNDRAAEIEDDIGMARH
jgi:uncharacterized protein YecT (DUF1311 family)